MKYEIETPFFLERLKAGDPEAYTQVIESYTIDLFKMGRGMRVSSEKIDDAIQDSFITFKQKIPGFEGRSKIKTFLIGIFLNKLREGYRFHDKANPGKVEEILNKKFGPNGHWLRDVDPGDPEKTKLKKEQLTLLKECLKGLGNAQREAIGLKLEEGLSNKEICHILALKSTNLRQILFRAKNALKICIEEKLDS